MSIPETNMLTGGEFKFTNELRQRIINYSLLGRFVQHISPLNLQGKLSIREDKDPKEWENYQERINLLTQALPTGWFVAGILLKNFLHLDLKNKIEDPQQVAHGLQHFHHLVQNFITSSIYTPEVVCLASNNQLDYAVAGFSTIVTHDLPQIDTGIKDGHDHAGAVWATGSMLLAQAVGVNITDRQIALTRLAVYHHSQPERFNQMNLEIPSNREIMAEHPEFFRSDAAIWLKEQLTRKGISLADEEFPLEIKSDGYLARQLIYRFAATDKRDSNTPTFSANTRTVMTLPDRSYIDYTINHLDFMNRIFDHGFSPKPDDFHDDFSRLLFELTRDYRAVGMSAFEISWLAQSTLKRARYTYKFAEAMIEYDFSLVTTKYQTMIADIREELEREHKLTDPLAVSKLDRLMVMISAEERAVLEIFRKKSILVQQSLINQKWTKDQGLKYVADVIQQILRRKEKELATVVQIPDIPYLPLYTIDFSVI